MFQTMRQSKLSAHLMSVSVESHPVSVSTDEIVNVFSVMVNLFSSQLLPSASGQRVSVLPFIEYVP